MIEPQQLRYFVRVAEERHFTRAAAAEAIAQPSLSQAIRKLEQRLGFALFLRDAAGVMLTREGELFLPFARAVLDRWREAEVAAGEIRGVEQGSVTLGVSPIAGARLLPALLRAVAARYPALRVQTREAGLSLLVEWLVGGAVDLAMVLLPLTDPRLDSAPVLAEELLAVMPAGHRLAEYPAVDIAALAAEPLVLLTVEYGLRQRVLEECARAGVIPRIAHESREVSIIQGLVEADLGVTVLPESAIRRDLRTVTRPLAVAGGEAPERRIGLAIRREGYVSLAARAVFALVREVFPAGGAGPDQRPGAE